uniref:W2 domain-containing protein n=1 Tax=Panagrellus redivivus TaxID=6233 RepID=A0A7E4V8Q7_PANRE
MAYKPKSLRAVVCQGIVIGPIITFLKNVSNDDGDWAEPLETEALSAHIGKLVIDKDLDKSVDDRLDMLHAFFIKAKKDGSIKNSTKMLNEAQRLELKTKAPLLLADVLLDQNVLKQLKEYENLFLRFLEDDPKAQRNFLGGIEQLIQKHSDIIKSLYVILYACYINDLIVEDVIVAWAAKVKKSLAREIINASQEFLKWLAEAEEEDDEDKDVDNGIEVDFDERAQTVGTTVIAEAPNMNGTTTAASNVTPLTVIEDGKEVDIDNI